MEEDNNMTYSKELEKIKMDIDELQNSILGKKRKITNNKNDYVPSLFGRVQCSSPPLFLNAKQTCLLPGRVCLSNQKLDENELSEQNNDNKISSLFDSFSSSTKNFLSKKLDENLILEEHKKLLDETNYLIEYKKKGFLSIIKSKDREQNIESLVKKFEEKYNITYDIPFDKLSDKIDKYQKSKKEHDILYIEYKRRYPKALNIDHIYLNK